MEVFRRSHTSGFEGEGYREDEVPGLGQGMVIGIAKNEDKTRQWC